MAANSHNSGRAADIEAAAEGLQNLNVESLGAMLHLTPLQSEHFFSCSNLLIVLPQSSRRMQRTRIPACGGTTCECTQVCMQGARCQ